MIVVHLPQRGSHTGHKTALQKKVPSIYNHVPIEVWKQTAPLTLIVMDSDWVSWLNPRNEAGLALYVWSAGIWSVADGINLLPCSRWLSVSSD